MGFDDLFEHGHRGYKNSHDRHSGYDDHYQSSHSGYQHQDLKLMLLGKLQNNPKLKALLVFAAIALLVVVVIAAIILFPLLVKLFNYITANGIQGIINAIWSGTK